MKKGILKIVASGLAAFALFAGVSCQEEKKEKYVVYMPDGAPALALAGMMKEDIEGDGVEYRVVAPQSIAAKVTAKKESENADFCILPATAAGKLLGTGERYQMLGSVTRGNLYLLAKGGDFVEDLSLLLGKRVGVLQINEVPGLTFKATLNKAGVAWQELKSDGEFSADKVNLVAIAGAEAVGVVEADYFLVAEPAASAQAGKGYSIVGDLQALYGGKKGYPQAVLVAKRSIVEGDEGFVAEFVESVENSLSWVATASGEELVAAVRAHMDDPSSGTSLKAPLLTSEVVARCGISFTYAQACATETSDFLAALKEINDKATNLPSDDFYWR